MRTSFARTTVAVLALLVMLVQGTWVLAGTTGGIAGAVTDAQTGKAISGAKVSVASPSQSASATTDAQGRYSFVSLTPDTYTLTIAAPGYQAFSQAGLTVVADQTQSYSFTPTKQLQQIGRISARSASDLVKPGQTADVYSISGQLSQNTQGLSGGAALFQTFAALSSVPGVYVPQGSNFGQNNAAPYIRGGNYNQVGFEFDGIPVNRAFDNYASNTQGITGQQELQVYTGGVPASSAGEGLSGYINQVIKSGTYPATANIEGVAGTSTFYHYLRGEYGGSTPSRNLSYYVGTTGWNQSQRYGNNSNGNVSDLLTPYAPTFDGTGGTVPYGPNIGNPAYTSTRETVANVHIGIPHKNGDGGRDDVQFLGSIGRQYFKVYDSLNDMGGVNGPFLAAYDGASAYTLYGPKTVYNGPLFNGYNPALASTYYYPSASAALYSGVNAKGQLLLNPDFRGGDDNNNGIFKVQYQKNIGSSAYIRLYGYSNYSSWSIFDPVGYRYAPATAAGALDYELDTHTRGLSLEFADQINSKNLLQGSASYTFANVVRYNNSTPRTAGFYVQDRGADGLCYDPTSGANVNCYSGNTLINGYKLGAGMPALSAGNPGTYQVVSSGYTGTLNQVQPKFSSFSLSDDWQVSNKVKLTAGLRFNHYIYALADTANQAIVGGSNNPLFIDYNAEHCYDPNSVGVLTITTVAPNGGCPAGQVHTNLSNTYPATVASTTLEPRLGGTISLSPYDVVRFSAGKYSQPVISAYTQYNLAGDVAAFTESNFLLYGYNTPRHDARPQIAYNYDLSYEKRLPNTPLTFSLSPFYRTTKDQSQSFFLDPKSNFVSGLNVGTLRAFGYELLTRFGDFNRDGLSAQVSFTYTNSKIRYNNFPGTNRNIIDILNSEATTAFNKLTSARGGFQCYDTGGNGMGLVGGACPAGTNANPYYNMQPVTQALDPNGYYSPYDVVPSGSTINGYATGYSSSYEVPYVTTAIVQYKKKGWRFVPSLQYDSGFKYGSPFSWVGYDPSSGCPAGTTTPDATCGIVFRPDPYTGRYDSLGQFKNVGTLTLSAQISKDLSKRVTVTAILTNLWRHCFHQSYAWDNGGNNSCAVGQNWDYNYGGAYVGNAFGATSTNPLSHDPYGYAPSGIPIPFNAFVSVQVKM
jgi:hypothetical protein